MRISINARLPDDFDLDAVEVVTIDGKNLRSPPQLIAKAVDHGIGGVRISPHFVLQVAPKGGWAASDAPVI